MFAANKLLLQSKTHPWGQDIHVLCMGMIVFLKVATYKLKTSKSSQNYCNPIILASITLMGKSKNALEHQLKGLNIHSLKIVESTGSLCSAYCSTSTFTGACVKH